MAHAITGHHLQGVFPEGKAVQPQVRLELVVPFVLHTGQTPCIEDAAFAYVGKLRERDAESTVVGPQRDATGGRSLREPIHHTTMFWGKPFEPRQYYS